MHVICIDDPRTPIKYRIYSGFEIKGSFRTGKLNSKLGVIVMTFTKTDAKIIDGNIYLSAEYAEYDMRRVLEILQESGSELPRLYIKPLLEVQHDLLNWR